MNSAAAASELQAVSAILSNFGLAQLEPCCESTIYLPAPAAVMLAASLAAASPAALDIYAKSLPILAASSPATCSTTGRPYNTFVPLGFGGVAQLAKFSFHQ